MEKHVCKNIRLELSVPGTGCWTFGGGEYRGNKNQKDVTTDARIIENDWTL